MLLLSFDISLQRGDLAMTICAPHPVNWTAVWLGTAFTVSPSAELKFEACICGQLLHITGAGLVIFEQGWTVCRCQVYMLLL